MRAAGTPLDAGAGPRAAARGRRFVGVHLVAVLVALAWCPKAAALYGGYEDAPRTFDMGIEYFVDVVSYEPALPVREAWHESEFRPGGPRGYRIAFGSIGPGDEWMDNELVLSYAANPSWTWFFRYFRGQDPDGRFEHEWLGMTADLRGGWYAKFLGEVIPDKENLDVGVGIGRERAATPDRILYRWELRAIFPDLWYNGKNTINARHENTAVDLQFSLRAALGPMAWAALEVDRDLPFRKAFGENDAAVPSEQNFRFGFEKCAFDLTGGVRLDDSRRIWARVRDVSCDRSRDYFAPGHPENDWDTDYRLASVQVECWKTLVGGHEVGFGFEHAEFDEKVEYPNAVVDAGSHDDRADEVFYARYRRRMGPACFVTTGLYVDFVNRDLKEAGEPASTDRPVESKISFSLEIPGSHGELTDARLIVGATFQLDQVGFGGAFGQWVATF